MSEPVSFRKKVLNSAKLSSLRFASQIGLRLISTIVLTRLLAPEVYGVFAVVLVYLYLLEMLSDIGIRPLILTREGEVADSFLRTCWSVNILRGLAIAVLSALIALVIGVLQARGAISADSPYSAEILPLAFIILGLTSFGQGFQSPMPIMSERRMEFGRVTLINVGTNVISLIVTIALAFYFRSIWALILGNVARAVLLVFFSYWFFKGPKLRFDLNRADLGVVIDRGKWIMGQSALTAFSQSADRLVLGFVMTSATFGFYAIARQLAEIVYKFLIALNGQMAVQVFSHLQKSTTEEFTRNYYKYRLFFDAVAGVSAGGLLVVAPMLVQIVFDDRYQDVAPMVQILAVGILLTGPILLHSAFIAERRFKRVTYLAVVSTATLWIGLAITVFMLDSVTAALFVVAAYRLPEAAILWFWGAQRNWIVIWREFLPLVFLAIGAAIGWVVLAIAGIWL